MKKTKDIRHSLSFHIASSLVLLLLVFSILVSTIGYLSFSKSFKKEYAETSNNMADTATMLVDGNRIDYYLKNGVDLEYKRTLAQLDEYCNDINVSIVYVIAVDTSDYGRFVSVFNSIDNTVDNTNYKPWDLGYERETTNDEYREAYKALYEKKKTHVNIYRTKNLNGTHPHITTLVPITDRKGNVTALMCMQRPMSEFSNSMKSYLTIIAVSTLLICILIGISATGYLRRQFVRPIRKITDESARFAKENTVGDKLGDLSKINELSILAKSIDRMEEDMLSYVNNLTSVTAEKERIGTELSVASNIQENSLPNIFPAFPERAEFDLFATMTPAKEVGGDFYNFFLIDDDHLAFSIADVSGKGVPAALFMMVTNILISERVRMGGTPAEILTFVNNRICEHNTEDMFVTVWLGILEVSTGKITAANAGHDNPAVMHQSGDFEIVENKHGVVVGAMEGIVYKDFEIQLNHGDKIFLYTDGVPEATDKNNNMFGLDNMVVALNKYKENSPEKILEGVNASVEEFVGDAPQFDDLTMLCIELKNKENKNSITVDADVDKLQDVMDFVDAFLEENNCSFKVQTMIDLSVEELFVNIANYAYGDGKGTAEISVKKNGDAVEITLKDSGVPYNPLEKEDPDTSLSAEERTIGGLGIFLVKKNMDDIQYEYKDNMNVLKISKNI